MSNELPWPYFLQLLDLLAREDRLQRDDLIRAVQPDFDARLFGAEPVEPAAREAVIEATVGRLSDELLDEHGRRTRFDYEAETHASGVAARYVVRELCKGDELRTSVVGQLAIGIAERQISKPAAAALLRRLKTEGWSLAGEPIIRWLHLGFDGGEPS